MDNGLRNLGNGHLAAILLAYVLGIGIFTTRYGVVGIKIGGCTSRTDRKTQSPHRRNETS